MLMSILMKANCYTYNLEKNAFECLNLDCELF